MNTGYFNLVQQPDGSFKKVFGTWPPGVYEKMELARNATRELVETARDCRKDKHLNDCGLCSTFKKYPGCDLQRKIDDSILKRRAAEFAVWH